MKNKDFSKGDAIRFGFERTKKYFGVILQLALIVIIFTAGRTMLDHNAGRRTVDELALGRVLPSDEITKAVVADLTQNGYFSERGLRTQRLLDLSSADELDLSADLEPYRRKIFRYLELHQYRLPFPRQVYLILVVVLWFIEMWMGMGLTRMSLQLARDEAPIVTELFSDTAILPNYILASVIMGACLVGGLLLFVIPGIFVFVVLQFFGYAVIDERLGPIQALFRSRVLTRGARWNLLSFAALNILLNIGGLLCLGIGLLVTIPASSIACSAVFDHLKRAEDAVAVDGDGGASSEPEDFYQDEIESS